jgi:hypothetical protein
MYSADQIDQYPTDPVDLTEYKENDGNYFLLSGSCEKGYYGKFKLFKENQAKSVVNKRNLILLNNFHSHFRFKSIPVQCMTDETDETV